MSEMVERIREGYLSAFSKHVKKGEPSPFYVADLVMFGLMDRNIALVEAMPHLIEEENIHAFAPLLRVQLDGLLRLHAFRIVGSPDELARHVLGGGELRKFKDKEGNKLTDRHLVISLKLELPWVESIYERLCGWVHFSESHIFAAVSEGEKDGMIEIGIGGYRKKIDDRIFQEAIEA